MDFAVISKKNKDRVRLRNWGIIKKAELGILNGDTEEWRGARKKYECTDEDLGAEISLSVGFGKLRGRLSELDENRQRMQMPQERMRDNINGNAPTILEENEENESAISIKYGPKLGDLELANGDQSETI